MPRGTPRLSRTIDKEPGASEGLIPALLARVTCPKELEERFDRTDLIQDLIDTAVVRPRHKHSIHGEKYHTAIGKALCEGPRELEAAEAGHVHGGDERVRPKRFGYAEGVRTAIGHADAMTDVAQHIRQMVSEGREVVDDQHTQMICGRHGTQTGGQYHPMSAADILPSNKSFISPVQLVIPGAPKRP